MTTPPRQVMVTSSNRKGHISTCVLHARHACPRDTKNVAGCALESAARTWHGSSMCCRWCRPCQRSGAAAAPEAAAVSLCSNSSSGTACQHVPTAPSPCVQVTKEARLQALTSPGVTDSDVCWSLAVWPQHGTVGSSAAATRTGSGGSSCACTVS
jgi:hypothetical protein